MEFFTPVTVHSLLLEKYDYPENVPWIIQHAFAVLAPTHFQQMSPYYKAVESNVIDFIRRNKAFAVIAALCQLLLQFKHCIPQRQYTSTFCSELLRTVSYFTVDKDPIKFISAVSIIAELFRDIWARSDDVAVNGSLHTVFQLLSDEEGGREKSPSFCLGAIVQHIPQRFMAPAVQHLLKASTVSDATVSLLLRRMCKWTSWPGADRSGDWIKAFFNGLIAAGRISIVKNTIETEIDQVSSLTYFSVSLFEKEVFLARSAKAACFVHFLDCKPTEVSTNS